MVTRYAAQGAMQASATGDFVRIEDYELLVRQLLDTASACLPQIERGEITATEGLELLKLVTKLQ